jgi:hypothetical protein
MLTIVNIGTKEAYDIVDREKMLDYLMEGCGCVKKLNNLTSVTTVRILSYEVSTVVAVRWKVGVWALILPVTRLLASATPVTPSISLIKTEQLLIVSSRDQIIERET